MKRIVLLGTAEHLDGSIQLLLSADERIVLLYLIRDAGNQLVPILRLSTSAILLVFIIIVVIIVLIISIAHQERFVSRFVIERIIAIHARQELTLSVSYVLTQQKSGF